MESSIQTLLWTWRTSSSGIDAPPAVSPRQLNTTGMRGAAKSIPLKYSRRASPAGAISGVWKGPLTFSGRQRFAPFSFASAAARSTAARSPPITSCPGQL